ncbi:signal peptidase I [soil metagenome]
MPDTAVKPSILRVVVGRLLGQSKKPTTNPRDSFREGLETVVFVVVLVFLLKQFVVEAFVIPTGSMAETLYGYRKALTCQECGYEFQLNASCEVDPSDGHLRKVQGYCCPNCRNKQAFSPVSKIPYTSSFWDKVFGPGNASGDRVLVHKALFHKFAAVPGDVVVFKYPKQPQKDYSAQNYIKRMWAIGGQTLAIWRGDLYRCESLKYGEDIVDDQNEKLYPRPENSNDLWELRYTYHNNDAARRVFEASKAAGFPDDGDGFKLIRKSDTLINEMTRIVYDNDFQNTAIQSRGVPPRWKAEASDWTPDDAGKVFTHSGSGLGWLRYRHLQVEDQRGSGRLNFTPGVVDNFLGYNGETGLDPQGNYYSVLNAGGADDQKYWVGDLVLDCSANVTDATAEVVMELSKGPNRFQAKFKDGNVTLHRTGPGGKDMATAKSGISTGNYALRFANIDCRLHVWVNGKAIAFGKDADYAPSVPDTFDPLDEKEEGWTRANDIEAPVSVGATGGVTVSKLKIGRDTYYIHANESYRFARHISSTVDTYYAQPGHYVCLGDNSAQSSDSRVWGTVPERLLLGKAMFIFFPLERIGFIK